MVCSGLVSADISSILSETNGATISSGETADKETGEVIYPQLGGGPTPATLPFGVSATSFSIVALD